MYYGNGCLDEDPQDATGVWDSNYKGIWHLAEKYGLDFDGADSYVDTNYSTHHTQTTIEAWIYPEGWGEDSYGRVIDKLVSGTSVLLLYLDSSGRLTFRRYFSGGLGDWKTQNSTIVLDTWQHIAVIYDESDPAHDPSIYINGQLQTLGTDTNPPSGTANTNTDDYIVGNRSTDGVNWDRTFEGIIDELRIYSRILTSEEISDRYPGKREPSRDGLVFEYLMDEGSGNTVSDSSGNGHDGDMTGHAAAWVRPRAHDSTDNSNVGGRMGSMAAPEERINGCDPFDDTDDYMFVADDSSLDIPSSFTVEAWARWASTSSNGYILEKGTTDVNEKNYYLWWSNDAPFGGPNTSVVFGFSKYPNTCCTDLAYDWTPEVGEWYHVVGVFDDVQDELRIYVGGMEVAQKPETNTPQVEDGELRIGRDRVGTWGGDVWWHGMLDEIRISSGVRTDEWIETCFNNQKEDSTFFTLGDPDCSYGYRRSIKIDGDEFGGSSGYLTNFPVLVNLSGDWLKTAPDGDIQHASGWDIIFRGLDSTTCDGTAPCDLDFEIEKYDGSTGELVAWVRVPQVYAGDGTPSNDTVIYMYYGNGCIDQDPQNATGVWDSNFKGVWHLAEKYALDFDGADDYVDTGYNTHHTQTTIEAWIYPEGWGEGQSGYEMGRVIDKREGGDQVLLLYLYNDTADAGPDENLRFERVFGDHTGSWRTPDNSLTLNNWYHIAVTYDESDPDYDPCIYINGELQSLTEMETPSGTANTNTDDYIVGNRGAGDRTFDGVIDELRIYSRILTSEEISDRYLGKRGPSRDGLVFEYLMDEGSGNTVSDSSGNGHDGDMTGHAAAWVRSRVHDSTGNGNSAKRRTLMAAPVERINGCDPFDGSDDSTRVEDYARLDMGTYDFTLKAWARLSTSSTDAYPTIIYKGAGSVNEAGYWFFWFNDAVRFTISNGSGILRPKVDSDIDIKDDDWHHVVAVADRDGADGTLYLYIDGDPDPVGGANYTDYPGSIDSGYSYLLTSASAASANWMGDLDEVRVSREVRSDEWIETCFNNQKENSTFFTLAGGEPDPPTVVELGAFRARGVSGGVLIEWETKSEVDNLGFNLYRSTAPDGSYTKLNPEIIPGLISSMSGRSYTYTDTAVERGALYYYKLEDIDLDGSRTLHGPVCVDWDAEGTADDGGSSAAAGGSGSAGGSSGSQRGRVSGSGGGGSSGSVGTGARGRQIDSGVFLEWQGRLGTDNLGYHVYREKNGKLRRLNHELVPGSLFSARSGAPGNPTRGYAWWDNHPRGRDSVQYWVEDVRVSGERSWQGPIVPQSSFWGYLSEVEQAILSTRAYEQAKRAAVRARAKALRKQLGEQSIRGQAREADLSAQEPEGELSNQEVQWALASGPAIKLMVKETGWYRVGQPALVASGLDADVDPRYLKLYMNGREVAIRVRGERDGHFDPEDFIEFYAKALDRPFTDTRAYWLSVDTSFGERIKRVKARGKGERPRSFPFSVEREDKQLYLAALRNGDEDNFFGALVWTDRVDQILLAPYVDSSASEDALLEVVLQGVTEASHEVKVKLNDVLVGEVVFEGQGKGTLGVWVPPSMLVSGENLLSFEAQGGEMDMSVVDRIGLRYFRRYRTDDEALSFRAEGGQRVVVKGFEGSPVRVMDITDPRGICQLKGRVKSRGSGYAVKVKVADVGQRRLFAFSNRHIKEPFEIRSNAGSSWHGEDNGADLVIIAHGDFMGGLDALAALRESQGFSVAVVDVEDLYDEFGFGAKSARAIRDFLSRAYALWDLPPRYVLFVGDASFDPRNHLGLGDYDFVPTMTLNTEYLETASDDWFGDMDEDGLADMAIGRLPVRSTEEALSMVEKIIAYEQEEQGSDVVLVADAFDGSFDFEGACLDVEALIPQELSVFEIFRGQSPTARGIFWTGWGRVLSL